jgi:tetratricopeptide (TPR) repeat protein
VSRAAALLAALCACAHAAPGKPQTHKIEFTDPVVITAGPPAQIPLAEMDDATLFDAGTRAFQAGELEKAALHFDRLWQSFPASAERLPALWNAALADERLGRFSEALERFSRYLADKDEVDGQFHAALCEYKLGKLDEAARRLEKLAARPGLSLQRKGEALIQQGVCRIEGGQRAEGERLLRASLQIFEKEIVDEGVDPSLPAQAEFWLGEAYRGYVRDLKLDPVAMDEKQLGDALESKAEFLLSAQGHYLRSIRKGDGEWATAAGFRIGELYEEFHDELVGAPLPRGLTEEQRGLYQEELGKKVRNLISKAIRIYEQTLSTAQRVGAKNSYVERTEQALERLRKLLLVN